MKKSRASGSKDAATAGKEIRDAALAHYAEPTFSAAIVAWQKQHGRHHLPWQNTRDAFRVWLSEIMLQQTQVSAVLPYYERFLSSFPDVQALAAAPAEQVMAHWSGLGYYTRARNLHKCAQQVVQQHGGQFPADPGELQQLPGIGRSTAAAISAFSHGTRAAILDGNVKRVFARVFGIAGYPGAKPVEDDMWLRAQALLPAQDMEAYTQGLMDMGATLCTRSSPQCGRCPLQARCIAHAEGRTAELPTRKPKRQQREKQAVMLIITHDDQVLLEQRPDSGIWGGLLSLPELDGMRERDEDAADSQILAGAFPAAKLLAQRYGQVQQIDALPPFSHVFTHFKLNVQPIRFSLSSLELAVAEAGQAWYAQNEMAAAPLPAPVKKLLLALFGPSLWQRAVVDLTSR